MMLNDVTADKIRKYRADYNNRPSSAVSFMPAIASTSGRLHSEFSDFYSYRLIGKLTVFLQIQEFSLRKQTPVVSSTSTARFSLPSLKAKLAWLSLRQQPCALILT
jgi:hypothetical protein